MTMGGVVRLDGAELGNRHLEVRQHLEQVGLERLVGAVQFVDEQHRRRLRVAFQRLQQRPADEEALVEDVRRQLLAAHLPARLGQADLDHLARIVPFVRCRARSSPS
jgi:hypothetical protein